MKRTWLPHKGKGEMVTGAGQGQSWGLLKQLFPVNGHTTQQSINTHINIQHTNQHNPLTNQQSTQINTINTN